MTKNTPSSNTSSSTDQSVDQSVMDAMQHLGRGQIREADEICRELIEKNPLNAPTLQAAGLVAYMQRDYETAVKYLGQAVQINDRNCQYYGNLGEAHRRAGNLEDALAAFERSTVLKPDFLKGYLGLGNTLHDMGKNEEAVAKFRLALAINPNFAEAYHYLGVVFLKQESIEDALSVLRKAVAIRPDYPEAQLTLANALETNRDVEAALKIYQGLLEQGMSGIAIHNNTGNILKNLGRMDEAREHYQKALEIDPDYALAHYNLSRTRKGSEDDVSVERMEEMLADDNLPSDQRVHFHFSLGKIYDDQGLYEQAFHHFKSGNDLDERGEPFNAENHKMLVDRIMNVFTGKFLESRRGMGSESDVPVIIVGIPRSGTTLAEQTLSSHPQVHGAGELAEIGTITRRLPDTIGASAAYPEAVQELDALSAIKLAERYAGYLQGVGGNALRVTDKMPGNFIHLGLISLLLPNAKIINCRRDPLDLSLSCYFQHFTNVIPFSRDLGSLGHYFSDYFRLMQHWHDVLPMDIMDVHYEDMIADHEGMSRKIVAFAGLEWDDRCLEFYNLNRPVKTASSWQVRQPIYTSSVARWKNYEPHIGELKAIIDAIPGARRETPEPASETKPKKKTGRAKKTRAPAKSKKAAAKSKKAK